MLCPTVSDGRSRGSSSSSAGPTQSVALHLPVMAAGTVLRFKLEIRPEEQDHADAQSSTASTTEGATASPGSENGPQEGHKSKDESPGRDKMEPGDGVNSMPMQSYQVGGSSSARPTRTGNEPMPLGNMLSLLRRPVRLLALETLRERIRAWQALLDMLVVDEMAQEAVAPSNADDRTC